jgi:hypothetical protein
MSYLLKMIKAAQTCPSISAMSGRLHWSRVHPAFRLGLGHSAPRNAPLRNHNDAVYGDLVEHIEIYPVTDLGVRRRNVSLQSQLDGSRILKLEGNVLCESMDTPGKERAEQNIASRPFFMNSPQIVR